MAKSHILLVGIGVLVTLGVTPASWCQQTLVFQPTQHVLNLDVPPAGNPKYKLLTVMAQQGDHDVSVTKKRDVLSATFTLRFFQTNSILLRDPIVFERVTVDGGSWAVNRSERYDSYDVGKSFILDKCGAFAGNATNWFKDNYTGTVQTLGNKSNPYIVEP
ncbi:MAG: hypothetical protein NZT92_18120 [Abditibacteriales bacterium]|nr:hypothetical protein [Abditibacteriales bacterium]